ncbi:MAG: glycosyltransferase [Bacteroidales bacterium]|jgi:glycosyltransferase involved in cell wall biosynthesis|nr:glycosyltransferase [Bacteroidales bacterium]MDD4214369.1 glycosyltransferase [Bacteroidales bacterium]
MKYSIIIATYNRLEEVKELLASAENLDFSRDTFELIFSDDGSTDDTEIFLKNYKSSSGLNIRYLYQQNKGPGEARNHGMRKSQGEYFIFVDSDCMFPPEWLQKIDEYLNKEHLDAWGGPDTCHESFSPLLKAINYSMTSFIGTGGTRGGKKSVQKKFYPRSFNMGISRKVFETIGGMGGLRHGQDMEFSGRIYNSGFKVGLIADAFVYHKRRTSLKRFYKQVFNWGVARVNLGKMDKQMFKPIHFIPALLIAFFLLFVIITPFPFFPKWLWFIAAAGITFLVTIAFFQSLAKYKSLKTSLLSIITLYIQIIAYGLGMWKGLFQVWTGKGTAEGYSKNYYK